MPSPRPKPSVVFVCRCDEKVRPACDEFREYEDTGYCVLHCPGKEKSSAFSKALKRKIESGNFDFSGVWFPETVNFKNFTVNFENFVFTKPASFNSAKFWAEANFKSAEFLAEAKFDSAEFHAQANFTSSTFSAAADFYLSKFEVEANFFSAKFSAGAQFGLAEFDAQVNFSYATFKEYASFRTKDKQVFGDKSCLKLWFARIEKPDRVSFHTVKLRPHWFVDVDARKFEFINVDWHNINWHWRNIGIKREIESIKVSPPHRLLERACQNLAINAEENQRYEEASKFRYMAMDARRLERWHGLAFWTLKWWYWLASGYGEHVGKAFLLLLGILVLFAALYLRLGFPNWETKATTEKVAVETQSEKLGDYWSRLPYALLYSAGVMTLQKPGPPPATNAAQGLVMLETILGPVQAALLALAIRRKFMR